MAMLLKIILVVAAITQAAAPAFLFANGFDQGAGPPTPIVPAMYAFTIWGLIYGLGVVYSVAQLLSSRVDPALQSVLTPIISLFVLSTVWLLFARFGPGWATVPTIVAMLALATRALLAVRSDASGRTPFADWLALPLFGLYAGWLTIAVFANFTEVAAAFGFAFFGLGLTKWTLIALVPATALACAIASKSHGNWYYAAAVLWALVAIAVANVLEERLAVAAAAALATAPVLLVTLAGRRKASC